MIILNPSLLLLAEQAERRRQARKRAEAAAAREAAMEAARNAALADLYNQRYRQLAKRFNWET
ncbi:hypothetical protein Axy21_019 [Achromobacter phage vB_AxyP_19-32_Axy21]|uniref:Uncharacterized protein n=1 Tax=Achromobacter phage vB_AxyP_19-32_Axy21 TaxID=2591045 RepID=A0A514CVU9_9CAUD|nr:hypothetical protein Axy21_019 [Achromobacter phage vB_AxyP_19-32_Axy21]